jgi:phage FluMu gp28-like protein
MDIGRKKDRTVIFLLERVGDVFWTRMVKTLERTKFKTQFETVDALMPYVRRAASTPPASARRSARTW